MTKIASEKGHPILGLTFPNVCQQAGWITEQIHTWINSGIAPNEIAVLARQWDNLNPIRLLLERERVPTYALKKNGIALVRNRTTCLLINALQRDNTLVFEFEVSVRQRIENFFQRIYNNVTQPELKLY